ncbi:MAG: hypothetical protein IK024_06655 [Treponema sp.]|nr:hypothetical protein [Treponema sp.]
MEKNFKRFIPILFLMLLFIDCKSTQVESNSTENHNNNESLVLYCTKAKETYYLEDKKEIKKVLSLLPKIPNVAYNTKYMLTFGLFNEHPSADYTLYVKKNNKITKEYYIDIDNRVWITNKSFLTTWFFPRKNIEKIISKMHKGIKHTETIENLSERRHFIERLMSDNNVLYIDKRAEYEFKRHMGSFYIYVPSSEDENIDSREIVDNLREHYGDTKRTVSKEIHNYTTPKLKRYIEETQEFEYEMRWTKAMYDKIDIYRKGEFREENLPIHHTFDYYTKD